MTISSIIVKLKNKNYKDEVLEKLRDKKECEVITLAQDNIVCVVTTNDTDEQIAIFRNIQSFEGVDDIAMVYNYEELDEDIEKIKKSPKVSEILDDNVQAKDVRYSGSVNYKTK